MHIWTAFAKLSGCLRYWLFASFANNRTILWRLTINSCSCHIICSAEMLLLFVPPFLSTDPDDTRKPAFLREALFQSPRSSSPGVMGCPRIGKCCLAKQLLRVEFGWKWMLGMQQSHLLPNIYIPHSPSLFPRSSPAHRQIGRCLLSFFISALSWMRNTYLLW